MDVCIFQYRLNLRLGNVIDNAGVLMENTLDTLDRKTDSVETLALEKVALMVIDSVEALALEKVALETAFDSVEALEKAQNIPD